MSAAILAFAVAFVVVWLFAGEDLKEMFIAWAKRRRP